MRAVISKKQTNKQKQKQNSLMLVCITSHPIFKMGWSLFLIRIFTIGLHKPRSTCPKPSTIMQHIALFMFFYLVLTSNLKYITCKTNLPQWKTKTCFWHNQLKQNATCFAAKYNNFCLQSPHFLPCTVSILALTRDPAVFIFLITGCDH